MNEPTSGHPHVPVERRTYFHAATVSGTACPACGRARLRPWYLYRDRERRVWRRWVCEGCEEYQDRREDESA